MTRSMSFVLIAGGIWFSATTLAASIGEIKVATDILVPGCLMLGLVFALAGPKIFAHRLGAAQLEEKFAERVRLYGGVDRSFQPHFFGPYGHGANAAFGHRGLAVADQRVSRPMTSVPFGQRAAPPVQHASLGRERIVELHAARRLFLEDTAFPDRFVPPPDGDVQLANAPSAPGSAQGDHDFSSLPDRRSYKPRVIVLHSKTSAGKCPSPPIALSDTPFSFKSTSQ